MKEELYRFRFRDIVDAARDVIIVTDAPDTGDAQIVYVNKAFEELTGYGSDEVMGRNPRFLQGEERDQAARADLREAVANRRAVRARIRNFSKTGRAYWLDINLVPLRDDSGKVTHFAAIERDISAEVRREDRLRELAKTDELTELLNRRAFGRELEREMGRHIRYGSRLSLLLFDIDYFKDVNDEYGHAAGDRVLEAMGDLCRSAFRGQDVIGRIGGEEFAVILPETSHEGAMRVAERFRESVEKSAVMLEAMSLQVTVSIGVATAAEEQDGDTLLRLADEAMYRAKETGRNRVVSANEKPGESES